MTTTRSIVRAITGAMLCVALLCVSACGPLDAGSSDTGASATSTPAGTPGHEDEEPLCAPLADAPAVRIAAFQDKSRSTTWTRTEQIKDDDVLALVSIVCRGGGSIAIGLISDDSNRPLARLAISRPPAPPALEEVSNDPFEGPEARERNRLRREEYDVVLRRWRVAVDTRIEGFLEALRHVLEAPANAPRTDVVMALARAHIYFSEPVSVSARGSEIHDYLLLVTDGDDTARQQGAPSEIPARLLLVNGAGHQGMLKSYNPTRFEAVSAAIEYIANAETNPSAKD